LLRHTSDPKEEREEAANAEAAPAETAAALTLQGIARRRYGHKGPDLLGAVIVSQSHMRSELEHLLLRLGQHVGKLVDEQEQVASELAQLVEQDENLKAEHEAVLLEVHELKMRHEALVEASDQLSTEHEHAKAELAKARDALAAALHTEPTTDSSAQTDPVEPEIIMVEQPPSQETLAEIAEQVRREFATQAEEMTKMTARNAYLERKEDTYARMKEELDNAQALLANIGAKTAAMSSDLVEAREASREQTEVDCAIEMSCGVASCLEAVACITCIMRVAFLALSPASLDLVPVFLTWVLPVSPLTLILTSSLLPLASLYRPLDVFPGLEIQRGVCENHP